MQSCTTPAAGERQRKRLECVPTEPIRFLSLFSGIEAASAAWLPLGWECVAVAEIEKFPCAVLKHHYPDVPNLGDITKITVEQIKALGRIDLIVGGFPCQDISVAGKRKGMVKNETRSGLFYDAIRLVWAAREHCKLRWLLLENVPGIYSSRGGADFRALVNEILGAGFDIPKGGWQNSGAAASDRGLLEWATLDAQFFGLAQRRKRMFALADFGDWTGRPPILLECESMCGDFKAGREARKDVAPTISARSTGGGGLGTDFDLDGGLIASTGNVAHCLNAGGMGRQDYETETLIAHTLRGEGFDASEDGTGRGTPLIAVDLRNGAVGEIAMSLQSGGMGDERGICLNAIPHAIAFSCKDYGGDATTDLSPTLRSMGHHGSHANGGGQMAVAVSIRGREGGGTAELCDGASPALRASQGGGDKPHVLTRSAVRRLTPVECARLQGFPDHYLDIPWRGKPDAPDGVKYKSLGNSFAVPVVRYIGERIQQTINQEEQ